jgi:hypothetical protein
VVLTTYALVVNESGSESYIDGETKQVVMGKKPGALFRARWWRVVLDEV